VRVDLDRVRDMIGFCLEEPTTEDPWLEARYLEDIPIIGHTNPYYKLFYMIAMEFKPRLTVELGSYRGTAAAHFAAGNPDGEVITIDIHREDKVAQEKTKEVAAHYPNVKYLNGWTWDDWVVGRVKGHKNDIEVLFIDAWHEYQYAIKEWELYSPCLASEALVICDDLFDAQGATENMIQFWNELPGEKFKVTEIHSWVPMGFLRYVRP
jgi:predicted O-methyltransferase YrrM